MGESGTCIWRRSVEDYVVMRAKSVTVVAQGVISNGGKIEKSGSSDQGGEVVQVLKEGFERAVSSPEPSDG